MDNFIHGKRELCKSMCIYNIYTVYAIFCGINPEYLYIRADVEIKEKNLSKRLTNYPYL